MVKDVLNHLEWRQTNMPIPVLTKETLNLLNKGMMYVHGRSKDLCPIIIIDFKLLAELLKNNELLVIHSVDFTTSLPIM